jgi:hypothetical protein
MKVVTKAEMIETVRANVKGTSMVTVDLDSPMDGKGKMRTTGNPFAGMGIVKRETLNGTIGYIYANAVNRIADKEGKEDREAKQHPWGDMDEKHLFRIHRKTGAHYLSMQVKGVKVHGFFAPDGSEVPADQIRPFIPEKVKSSTQADLDGEVIARDYGMDNVTVIRAFGEEYAIGENIAAAKKVEMGIPVDA